MIALGVKKGCATPRLVCFRGLIQNFRRASSPPSYGSAPLRAYLVTHGHIFLLKLCGIICRRRPVTQHGLHSSSFYAWYLLYDCEQEGKQVLPNPRHKRLRHMKKLCKRRLSTIMLRLQSRHFLWSLHQSCNHATQRCNQGRTEEFLTEGA